MIALNDIRQYIDALISENVEMNWDNYFMINALVASLRSKDPNTKVGAVLVKDYIQIGIGYNGFPRVTEGNNDDKFTWSKDNPHDNKYLYVIHAEINAILNCKTDPAGSTLYVTASPCNNCMKHLAQAGIKRIVYLLDYDKYDDSYTAALKIAENCGIELMKMEVKLINNTVSYDEFMHRIVNYMEENDIYYQFDTDRDKALLHIYPGRRQYFTLDLRAMFDNYCNHYESMEDIFKLIYAKAFNYEDNDL